MLWFSTSVYFPVGNSWVHWRRHNLKFQEVTKSANKIKIKLRKHGNLYASFLTKSILVIGVTLKKYHYNV